MAIARINELQLYYEIHGIGKPLVLISGYTCDHSIWNLMLQELAQKFQVIVFDNRAVGQTRDDNRKFSLDTMAEDTIDLIKFLNLEKHHILGQSMGGAIAQIIAQKEAGIIDKLIILNSSAQFNTRTKRLVQFFIDARKKNCDIDLLIDFSLSCFFGTDFLENPKRCAEFRTNLITNPYPQTVLDQERQLHALLPFNSLSWLKEIKNPTLVISAFEDIICLPEESKFLVEGISNAQLMTVEGGHSSPLEAYEQVNQHLLQFLL